VNTMVDEVDPVEARLEALELRAISLSISEVLFSSMAGMIFGTVDEKIRKEVMSDLRDLVAPKTPPSPSEGASLKIEEEASRMLDEIEHIADDYRASRRGH
jgi:hypothetical protein